MAVTSRAVCRDVEAPTAQHVVDGHAEVEPEHRVEDDVRIELGHAAGREPVEDLDDGVAQLLVDLSLVEGLALLQLGEEDDGEERRCPLHVLEQDGVDLLEASPALTRFGGEGLRPLLEVGDDRVEGAEDRRVVDLLLGREEPVEERFGDPGPFGDVPGAGTDEALLEEHLAGRLDDLLPPFAGRKAAPSGAPGHQAAARSRMWTAQAEPRPITWVRPTRAPSICRSPASPRRWVATS